MVIPLWSWRPPFIEGLGHCAGSPLGISAGPAGEESCIAEWVASTIKHVRACY
ncbi:hypothetical protein U1Q18_047134 [Sarracenia purpurea var. burkii]